MPELPRIEKWQMFIRRYSGYLMVALVALFIPSHPAFAALLFLVLCAVLFWERSRTLTRIQVMRQALHTESDRKFEVAGGELGKLSHHLNRLRQHERAQQQLLQMIGDPVPPIADYLGHVQIPPEGQVCTIAVLSFQTLADPPERIAQFQQIAAVAQQQSLQHRALLEQIGDRLILVFGAVMPARPDQLLRSAYLAACALSAAAVYPHSLNLSAGQAHALALPGLGYRLIGTPIEHALLANSAPATLLCNEPTYLYLRRQGSVPPLEQAARIEWEQQIFYRVPLVLSPTE